MEAGFNKPYLTGNELSYIGDAVFRQKLSGDGHYTQQCQAFFEKRYHFKKVFLTTSCTAALEMAALLIDIQPGDEVIIPSYTFVSTANAFILRGAEIKFADSLPDHPNIDPAGIEELITPKTKAIVVVHYAGTACDMDAIMQIATRHNLFVIEDAAQAIDGHYKGIPLGRIGNFSCFSFHETKNITCGEGGMLVINDERFIKRAEIIWEKGTNRSSFFRGESKKYNWIDIGSSFLPSEINAAFLYAQLENIDQLQAKRLSTWNYYAAKAKCLDIGCASIPAYSSNNGHMFYLLCESKSQRDKLKKYLAENKIDGISHYLPLHLSPFYESRYQGKPLINAVKFSDTILRLPLYYELSYKQQDYVFQHLDHFLKMEKDEKAQALPALVAEQFVTR